MEGEGDRLSGSPLDRRLIFSNFLVGASNQLAHAAAQRLALAAPGDPLLFNPLYLHASVGLGKTHLLQAVAHAASSARRKVIYLTAERFMYGFVAALKAQTAIAFKERLRAIDLLVIDDIQFLQGKSIQQEFCHTLNALIDSRRQIVIAADRPPGDLESLEERVRSRLAGGLCIEVGALDEALRIKILEARIAAAKLVHPTFEVPAAVVAYVAAVVQTNGRDLDGAVNRLLAHASLNGVPLSMETAERAIRDLVRTPEPKKIKIEDIQKLVASHFNVSRADILSSRRTATVVRPRQIAMYLSKLLTPRSLPEIGRRFGGRDHTTVLHAVRKIHGSRHRGRDIVGRDRALEAHAFGIIRFKCSFAPKDRLGSVMEQAAIRIIGIDPGLRTTGWGVIEASGARIAYVASGAVRSTDRKALAERLCELHVGLAAVISAHAPAEAAVEETFVNRDPQSALKLGQARGIALAFQRSPGSRSPNTRPISSRKPSAAPAMPKKRKSR